MVLIQILPLKEVIVRGSIIRVHMQVSLGYK